MTIIVACQKGKEHKATYSLLPITFWVEAVYTACYVLNRALVTKSHNKTPYELLNGKFKGKVGEGFLVRKGVSDQHYIVLPLWSSISSTFKSSDDKAANDKPKDDTGSKIVEEPVNKEDQAYMDELDRLMSQEKEASDAVDALIKDNLVNAVSTSGTFSVSGPSSPYPDAFIHANTLLHVDQNDSQIPDLEDIAELRSTGIFNSAYDDDLDIFTSPVQSMGVETDFNNMESSTVISHIHTYRVHIDHPIYQILGDPKSAVQTRGMAKKISRAYAFVSYIHKQRRTNHKDYENYLFACFLSYMEPKKVAQALDDESWVEAMNKKDERGIVIRNKARLVAQGHRQEEEIDYDEVFAPLARIEAIKIFLAFASFMGFIVYQMDVKSAFLYGTIEEEVYVSQPFGFIDPHFPNKVYRVEKALYGLHQDPRAGYLKGQPKLGLWYPRYSPFDLEAYSNSDYVGANLDRKSTTGGCQFLGRRLISWCCSQELDLLP
nr:hypothetical protein [Tanacetum cinerariifolium]